MLRDSVHRIIRDSGQPLSGIADRIECGRETSSPGHAFPRRTVADLTLVWSESGQAEATVNGYHLVHRPGSLLACAPGFTLDERGDARQPWTACWLMLDGGWSGPAAAALEALPGRHLLAQPAPRRWLALATAAHRAIIDRNDGWRWRFASAVAELLGSLSAAASAAGPERLDARIASLVERSPERRWGLDELAHALGMSRSALAHGFPRLGLGTVAAFVRRRRCAMADALLAAGTPVGETAERLGFANPFHFSRCYRRIAGRPPSHAAREASRLRG